MNESAERKRKRLNDKEESDVLAALGSKVQNTLVYEEEVLRSAELEQAPKLCASTDNAGLGFPQLQGLTPSGHAMTDLPHMHAVLSKVRADLTLQPHNLVLLLKQQVLLNLIHSSSGDHEQCVRPQDELRHEEVRRQRFRRQVLKLDQQQGSSTVASTRLRTKEPKVLRNALDTNNKRSDTLLSFEATRGNSKSPIESLQDDGWASTRLEQIKRGERSVSFTLPTTASPRHRIGVQERKVIYHQDHQQALQNWSNVEMETKDQLQEHQEFCKKLRAAREGRRRNRRTTLFDRSSSDTSPNQDKKSENFKLRFLQTDLSHKQNTEQASSNQGEHNSTEREFDQRRSHDELEQSTTVALLAVEEQVVKLQCPLCHDQVVPPVNVDADAFLSQHMDQCQRTSMTPRGQRRSLRCAARKAISYAESINDMENRHRVKTIVGPGNSPHRRPPKYNTGRIFTVGEDNQECEDIETSQSRKAKPPDDLSEVVDSKVHPKQTCCYRRATSSATSDILVSPLDDFDDDEYEDRVDEWIEHGVAKMKMMKERDTNEQPPGEAILEGGLIVPAWINNRLFPYQRTGLEWMWELHQQQAGGILGDEMGLGKTVQICAFLGCMAASRKLKSVLLIAPATMLQHWLHELRTWSPGLRRILIHKSAETNKDSVASSKRTISLPLLKNLDDWLKAVRRVRLFEVIDEDDIKLRDPDSFCGTGYVLITTFENVRRFSDVWTQHKWSYVVIDEAQKIRNPDADITLVCKRLRTPHRIALSGTPIQNDLRELWSLFDFVFPGRLGTLPAFENEFADPIKRGGYSNASPMQAQLAYRCALVLKDLISPYLLRRLKKDIKEVNRMPGKKEQVLFCRLSSLQRDMYESFLQSDQVKQVIRGSAQMLGAITVLRKICNHPDLICPPDEFSRDFFHERLYSTDAHSDENMTTYENLEDRSGKLQVLAKILPLWKKQGHRVLIFCQWQKMLNIIQHFIELQGWKFGRIDGRTNVAARQRLVDTFNSDESYFGMLLTTRTGGVGLNLTGADRIILYDPDWNPQTDAQARERAWRFGQEREVTIYRLIVAGSVEEKIYQRQIFKTALSNRVLQDPKQRRLFSQRELKDLFSLQAEDGNIASGLYSFTETEKRTKGRDNVKQGDYDGGRGVNNDERKTMLSVLKSEGLAGVFDHAIVEDYSTDRQDSVRDMEEKARRVARDAVKALKDSITGNDSFTPTWTGSEDSRGGRFGQGGSKSANNLLVSIRLRNEEGKWSANTVQSSESTRAHTVLLNRIRKFVDQKKPSTEQILAEFSAVKAYDAAVFRRLLKSIAFIENGHWRLRE